MTTRLIYKKGKVGQEIKEGSAWYDGKELAEVDYTETTAWQNFAKIRFKGSNESYFVPDYRINHKQKGNKIGRILLG